MKQRPCVCGHVPTHHDKRKSIYQGLMADYKVIWACGWTGCGCPRYVEQPAVTGGSEPESIKAANASDQQMSCCDPLDNPPRSPDYDEDDADASDQEPR